MKYLQKHSILLTVAIIFSTAIHAQLYSYDKSERVEKDPAEVIKLIDSFAPALLKDSKVKVDTLAAKDIASSENLSERKKALQSFLKKNNAALKTLVDTLKKKPVLTDGEKSLLYFLEKKNTECHWLIPVRTVEQSKAFYENSDSLVLTDKDNLFKLEHAYLNYLSQSKKMAVYSEVANDFIGPVRLSLGLIGLVPSAKDSAVTTKKSDSIYNKKLFQDRFKSGGGIAQLNVSFPLLYIHDKRYVDFKVYASPRFCIDAPKEDTNVQRFSHHTQVGAEAQLKITTFEKTFTFLLCWRGFQAWGNSTFYDNMGFTGTDRKSFNFNTWTIGFIAKSKLQFYYTWYSGDTRATNQISKQNNNSLTANYQF
jgi:hypothetical protein